MKIEVNNKGEFIFHLENEDGEKISYGMSISKIQELCEEYVYEGIEDQCTSSSCNNESQNFCDCPCEYEGYEIKSISIKQHK